MFQFSMSRMSVVGPACFVMAGALFAGANTLVQAASMFYQVPSPTIAFWQYFIALVVVMPMVRGAKWTTARPVLHVLRVVLAAIGVQCWVAGLAYVPIWQAVALILTSPLFVTLGAGLILKEALTKTRVLAVMAGAFGGVLILAPWTDTFTWAALLPIAAAAFWAVSSLVTKALAETEPAQTLTLYLLVLLVPANGLATFGAGFAVEPSAIWLIGLAGLCVAAAQYLLAKAYGLADAAYLQPFDHLKLPLNVGLGLIVFGFAPPGLMWIGAGVIVAASAWVMREEV